MDPILKKEEEFHDKWAESIDLNEILVYETFQAATTPENRYILQVLGDVKGKKILDLGSGLGEASVFFAVKGADVTALDLSSGMLQVVKELAKKHNVGIDTVKSPSDKIDIDDETFDIVYSANLLHHVDIKPTILEVRRILKPGGIFVSWDPIAHNPIINVYRRMATEVRTVDEHPIRMKDLKTFRGVFPNVSYKAFWFTTLFIFIKFYIIDRVHPNDERYWKKIIYDQEKIVCFYKPLEKIDSVLLKIFPFLRRYCYNIVIVSQKN